MKKLLVIAAWLLLVIHARGGEIVLSGTYQGKSVYVQNPFNHSENAFCTKEVFVNDRKIFDAPKLSAFKIDLTHLKMNDLVIIRIVFADGCRPRVVNPHVIHLPSNFRFISSQTDNRSISWATSEETAGGQFVIERYVKGEGKWMVIKSLLAKGNTESSQYSIHADHLPGENQYRIRYEDKDGGVVYTVELAYTSNEKVITFHPLVVTTKLTLSDSTSYAITDFYGQLVKKGVGKEIILKDLAPGEYYISIQSRKEKFVKK